MSGQNGWMSDSEIINQLNQEIEELRTENEGFYERRVFNPFNPADNDIVTMTYGELQESLLALRNAVRYGNVDPRTLLPEGPGWLAENGAVFINMPEGVK